MCPSNEAERKEMSRVPYASVVGSLMFAMICTRLDIAQAAGAISRYMANPSGEHWIAMKRILRYIKGTSDVALCYEGSEFTVRGYVDSDFVGDLDKRKFTTGYVFTLAGAASALHIVRNPAFHSKTKHIGVQSHFVREVVEDGNVDLQKIHMKENLVDVLTKPINTDKFVWSRSSCGLAETKGGDGRLGPPRNESAGEKGLAACSKRKRFALKENVQFGTCKLPENFTVCQDLAKLNKVPLISDDLELECKGKDKYKCGSNVFWKW
ncbi:hypothetical protein WN944_023215 [Citrus x changshan-huyou]|uniref:Retrotransposon protein, putative, Ty1-copia subclass n=1 Tax=Citrus x changshan-huyou TaxID=2935761 RepID=A0AAP0R1U9_9ROSI